MLVTTPLALSIKKALPQARVDYLVFQGTQAVLAKNPYVDRVHAIANGSKSPANALRLLRRYDFALSTNPSDRNTLFAALAGQRSLGLTGRGRQQWWKRLVLDVSCDYDDSRHAVQNMLTLLEPLGIPKIAELTVAFDRDDIACAGQRLPDSGYVLLHPYSRGRYKYWPAERWGALAGLIRQTGLVPVFTITGDPADRELLATILSHAPPGCRSLAEPLTLNQLAAALHGCAAYVGIDTVVTHIAAAVGARTVALLGPTMTRYWAPWPNGCRELSPFAANRGVQRVGNVTVLQQDWPCTPCNQTVCGLTGGAARCLEQIEPEAVLQELLLPRWTTPGKSGPDWRHRDDHEG